jgi:hypothetical protein
LPLRTWSECLDRSARLAAAATAPGVATADQPWRLSGHFDPVLVAWSCPRIPVRRERDFFAHSESEKVSP